MLPLLQSWERSAVRVRPKAPWEAAEAGFWARRARFPLTPSASLETTRARNLKTRGLGVVMDMPHCRHRGGAREASHTHDPRKSEAKLGRASGAWETQSTCSLGPEWRLNEELGQAGAQR